MRAKAHEALLWRHCRHHGLGAAFGVSLRNRSGGLYLAARIKPLDTQQQQHDEGVDPQELRRMIDRLRLFDSHARVRGARRAARQECDQACSDEFFIMPGRGPVWQC